MTAKKEAAWDVRAKDLDRVPSSRRRPPTARLFFADILATFEAFERVVEVAKEGLEAGMEVDMGALMAVEMNEE